MGVWRSGSASALHAEGLGFDPLVVHTFCLSSTVSPYFCSSLQYRVKHRVGWLCMWPKERCRAESWKTWQWAATILLQTLAGSLLLMITIVTTIHFFDMFDTLPSLCSHRCEYLVSL